MSLITPAAMETCQSKGQQLTILYSHSVRVFDNVPADKAQAVMLLLSEDKSSSNRSMLDCGDNPLTQTQHLQISNKSGVGVEGAVTGSCPRQLGPVLTRTLTPAGKDNTQNTQIIKKPALTIKRSQAELPFARKASLARFLEKRKDRVVEAMKRSEEASACTPDRDDVGSPCKRITLPSYSAVDP